MNRICGECMHWKRGELENPCENGIKLCGYLHEDKPCWEQEEGQAVGDDRTKVCAKCGKELPVSMFYRYIFSADKLSALCKVCKPYKGKKSKAKEL